MSGTLAIELDTDVVECGDVVTGVVRWGPLDDVPRRTVVKLRYRTEGRGDTDSDVADTLKFPGAAGGVESVELRVPAEGPMSVNGVLITVLWEVELSLDVARRRDPSTSVAITVLPRGGSAVWARQVGAPPTC